MTTLRKTEVGLWTGFTRALHSFGILHSKEWISTHTSSALLWTQ